MHYLGGIYAGLQLAILLAYLCGLNIHIIGCFSPGASSLRAPGWSHLAQSAPLQPGLSNAYAVDPVAGDMAEPVQLITYLFMWP